MFSSLAIEIVHHVNRADLKISIILSVFSTIELPERGASSASKLRERNRRIEIQYIFKPLFQNKWVNDTADCKILAYTFCFIYADFI